MRRWIAFVIIVLSLLLFTACNNDTSSQKSTLVEQDYPSNGYFFYGWAEDNPCPLTIIANGDEAFFVKFVNLSGTGDFAFFVQPGTTIDVQAPLGSYIMKYASGTDWYGQTDLFGDDTEYFKIDDNYEFTYDDGMYYGYTVQLFSLQSGIFANDAIDADSF
jgi:hypothetical protein